MSERFRAVIVFLALLVLCFGVGAGGSLFTSEALPLWYASLVKPPFTPPSWLFAPVWTALYAMMAVAAFLIWRLDAGRDRVLTALAAFFVQLLINAIWTPAFFGLRSPLLGLAVIVMLDAAVLLTAFLFWRLRRAAALLLLPYLAWLGFATVLNAAIWRLNR